MGECFVGGLGLPRNPGGSGGEFEPALVAALADMDVPLDGSESGEELIEKIRDIVVGDVTVPLFDCAIVRTMLESPYPPSYCFDLEEAASFEDAAVVSRCNQISVLQVRISGKGSDSIELIGNDWEAIPSEDGDFIAEYICPPRMTKFKAQHAFDQLKFTAMNNAHVTLTISGFDAAGQVFAAEGTVSAGFGLNWRLLEEFYASSSWDAFHAAISTWYDLENLRKSMLGGGYD